MYEVFWASHEPIHHKSSTTYNATAGLKRSKTVLALLMTQAEVVPCKTGDDGMNYQRVVPRLVSS